MLRIRSLFLINFLKYFLLFLPFFALIFFLIDKYTKLTSISATIFSFTYFVAVLLLSSLKSEKLLKKELLVVEKSIEDIESKHFESKNSSLTLSESALLIDKLNRVAKKLEKRETKYKNYTKTLLIRNRQNNEIISAISHEFKNPISTILSYCQTLIEDENINANIRNRFLSKISSNASKLSNLLDRLSLSVRLENKSLELKKSPFFIEDAIHEAISQLSRKYKQREIKIEGEDRKVYADRVLIEAVLINLIENALKYSELAVEVEITPSSLKIKDRGLGLDENEIENITKKFYRVNKNSWNNSLGLGLFIVKYILELHGSALEIDSTPKIGSTFSFNI